LRIDWAKLNVSELANLFDDTRPAVVRRAIDELALKGSSAIPALTQALKAESESRRRNAVWALTRIEGRGAREALNEMFADDGKPKRSPDDAATRALIRSIGLWHDEETVSDRLGKMFATHIALSDAIASKQPFSRRTAAEALGRSGAKATGTQMLLRSATSEGMDRSLEHAIIYALVELNDAKQTRAAVHASEPQAKRIALISLDQMADGNLKPEEVTPLLTSTNVLLKQTASWIVSRHADWGEALASFFAGQLHAASSANSAEIETQLEQFARNKGIQTLLVKTMSSGNSIAEVIALHVLARSGLKELPTDWSTELAKALQSRDRAVIAAAVALVRSVPPSRKSAEVINTSLIVIAERADMPLGTRMAAAVAVAGGITQLSEPLYSRLVATLVGGSGVNEKSDAATALARATLSNARLIELAAHVKSVGPMELPKLLPAFAHSTNELVGAKLLDSLAASKAAKTLRPEILKPAITNFPASVRKRADEFLASLNTDAAEQKKHIDELLASTKGGDIRRGQAIFNSTKTACSSCHAIGYVGGNVGPDLTRVGQVRSERDLLEAVVFPSASFVRSYEPVSVTTKSGDEFSGVLRKDSPDEIVLVTGPNAEQRIARNSVAEMRPGTVSVMPSGLADQLSRQELADLIAFLKATRW
jgi:putative heme-binding domain-containing protein